MKDRDRSPRPRAFARGYSVEGDPFKLTSQLLQQLEGAQDDPEVLASLLNLSEEEIELALSEYTFTDDELKIVEDFRQAARRRASEQASHGVPQAKHSPEAARSMIHLGGISKVFYTEEVETHALSNIHLDIHEGEYVSIAGPSGCGKTTLLSILGLLDTPTAGEYWLNYKEVAKLSFSDRARIRNREIGFIFQAFNLISDLTVHENVELPLVYRGVSPAERKSRALEALERVGMLHRTKHYPSQLSGGQQQRVAVARAVVGKPCVLLADEPTGNLDSNNSEAVMGLLDELHAEGATICMVTHDPRWARHATRTVHLFDGRIVEEESQVSTRSVEALRATGYEIA